MALKMDGWLAQHGFAVFAWLAAAVVSLVGWSYAQGERAQATNAIIRQVEAHLEDLDAAVENLPTMEHRVATLERAAEKMDDVVRRLETAVVRVEQVLTGPGAP